MEPKKAESLKKDEVITLWQGLTPAAKIIPCPIAYKHEGTTIAEDGIRLCGSKTFILSVLSRLKDLLDCEGVETRLGVAFSQIQDMETKELIPGAYRCSVQVHERGGQAIMINRMMEGAKVRQAARTQREQLADTVYSNGQTA